MMDDSEAGILLSELAHALALIDGVLGSREMYCEDLADHLEPVAWIIADVRRALTQGRARIR